MIGIILLALLIIIIAICANPGFLTFLFCVALPVGIGVYALAAWLNNIESNGPQKKKSKSNQNLIPNRNQQLDITISDSPGIINKNTIAPLQEVSVNVPSLQIDIKGVWDDEREKISMGFDIENILIDGIRHRVVVTDELNNSECATAILMKSNYPFSWNRLVKSEIRGDILLVDYWLPSFDDMPSFVLVEFKNEQPICVSPNEKRIKTIWTDVSYKIVIRSLYELFSSIQLRSIESISFNGIIESLDLATGNETEKCILSLIVQRSDFEMLDLSRVDAWQCFKRFKGISAHDLSTLTPIPPLMKMNKTDKRFSDSYDVIPNIDSGENLAAMDWRDFENLIRELFEKEFSSNGSEVKITRASKDGGVDAVVFDPDPIRGGKIIIQAKRYTNIVGVSAVRDLYGTVMNEGATKGILVTTSDYGADSYNFAKDKPLTLLNGSNLLHLLGKHGCQAHINIVEAKKLLNATADE